LLKKTIWLLVAALVLTSAVSAAEILTLDQFVNTAIKNNPSYQISVQDYLIALEQNKSAKSLEDWNLVFSGLWNEANPAPISSFSSTHQKTLGYTVGLEKYIAKTGTAIQLEHANTRLEASYPQSTAAFNPPSKYYLSSVSLTIVQPLLKNAFGLATKNALKMSGYSLKLAGIKLAEDWEEFIGLLKGEYLVWQKCLENVRLVENKVKTVKDQLALTKKQLKYGLSEELDVVQLNQKLEAYRIMLEQARMACDTQTKKVLQLMGKNNEEKLVPEEFSAAGLGMDEATAIAYLDNTSNLKKTADILVDLKTVNLETKENAQLMDVSLVLSAKPNAFSQGFSDSISKIGQYSENTVTVTASRPLGNDQAEAEAEQAEIEHNKALKERENILLNANIGMASLYTNLNRLTNIIKLSESNLKLAKKRLALEMKKYKQGRNSIFFVLQAEDALLQAESSLNDTVFAKEEIVNQIKILTDCYLVEYGEVLKL